MADYRESSPQKSVLVFTLEWLQTNNRTVIVNFYKYWKVVQSQSYLSVLQGCLMFCLYVQM